MKKSSTFPWLSVCIQLLHHFLLRLLRLIFKARCSPPLIPSQNCVAGVRMYHFGANGIRYHRCCRTEHDGGRRWAPRASINNDSIRPIKFSADTISGLHSCGNCQQKFKVNEEIRGTWLLLQSVFCTAVQRKSKYLLLLIKASTTACLQMYLICTYCAFKGSLLLLCGELSSF